MSLNKHIDAELEQLRLQREQYLILHYKADGAIQALEAIRKWEIANTGTVMDGIPMSDFVKMVGGENATGSIERAS